MRTYSRRTAGGRGTAAAGCRVGRGKKPISTVSVRVEAATRSRIYRWHAAHRPIARRCRGAVFLSLRVVPAHELLRAVLSDKVPSFEARAAHLLCGGIRHRVHHRVGYGIHHACVANWSVATSGLLLASHSHLPDRAGATAFIGRPVSRCPATRNGVARLAGHRRPSWRRILANWRKRLASCHHHVHRRTAAQELDCSRMRWLRRGFNLT
jgi:hypothetical protein